MLYMIFENQALFFLYNFYMLTGKRMEELNKLHGKELEEAELTDEEKKYVNTLLVPPDPNISEEEKEKIRKEIMEKILWFKID